MNTRHALIVLTLAGLAAPAGAQALLRGPRETHAEPEVSAGAKSSLHETSLIAVEAPKPKTFSPHDLITIIISENSRQSGEQKLDTKQDTSIKGALNKFPDPTKLIEGELTNGQSSPIVQVDESSNSKWKGDAKYERSDRFTDKISAEVIEVKPNGVLVLEARRSVTKDDEVQSMVLAGTCRREDVTNANTILSSQLADMTLTVKNEGELRDTNKPGWITRVFRTIFAF